MRFCVFAGWLCGEIVFLGCTATIDSCAFEQTDSFKSFASKNGQSAFSHWTPTSNSVSIWRSMLLLQCFCVPRKCQLYKASFQSGSGAENCAISSYAFSRTEEFRLTSLSIVPVIVAISCTKLQKHGIINRVRPFYWTFPISNKQSPKEQFRFSPCTKIYEWISALEFLHRRMPLFEQREHLR